MSTDEMTDVEARALLGRALDTEPVVHLHPESVLVLARRSRARRRLAAAGSLAVAVAALAVGSTLVARHGGGSPTGVEVATAPTSKYRNPTAAPDAPVATDDRSRRLTDVLNNAHIVPPGMRVEDPGEPGDPMVFGTSSLSPSAPKIDLPGMYGTSALLADTKGSGKFQVVVSETRVVMLPMAGELTCEAFREKAACEERTLPGGIKAVAVTKLRRPVGVTMSERVFVFAARANGSYVMVYVDNGCDCDPDNPNPRVTRDTPPLDVETMFRIAGLPGMEY